MDSKGSCGRLPGSPLVLIIMCADFLKVSFFARPIFLFKSFAQTKWAKTQQQNF